jgi:diguanylate cyclase (GGDEF)-like protein
MQNLSALFMIKYTSLTVIALFFVVGIVMIRSTKQYGILILVLGLLDLAWVSNNLIFSYILKMSHMAPYIISQIILLLNAVGLIQLYFKEQKDAIREGLENITYLTFHDGLTGLYNKTYFDNKLKELESNNEYLPISLIIGDMNGLKFFNDVFGHHEGDHRLKKMALIIQQSCRQNDIIARWGGDEFAIILPNTDKKTAYTIRDKITAACNSFQGVDLLLSLSLGVATKTDAETSLSMVIQEAEELMYQVKLTEGRKLRGAIAQTLVEVLQANGYEMKGHIERIQNLAKEFARVLGFSAENLDILVRAATLHDIGKIGISKDIILKRTPLDDAEWLIMKKHVEIGYRITQALVEFAHLADIILYHHEWWNGEGYPQGLKGEEIPLMSRIISILDAFDVMTHRQYNKPTMTTEEALLELHLKAGSQFDPNLVQLFIQMMNGSKARVNEA